MSSKKRLYYYQILSAIFAMILGTILHFTYEWSGHNTFIGLFSAINESTWEHLKLSFFPMLITGIIGYFIFKNDFSSFLCSKTIGIITALSFTVMFFYTYTGIIGTNYTFINILIFILSVIIGEYVTHKLTLNNIPCTKPLYTFLLILFTILFIAFTFNPPKIYLFKDPIDNSYGISKSL